MKRRIIVVISLLFCIGIIGFTACEKIEKDTPQAIKKLIREKKKRDGQVIEYEYNNESIYCLWHPCIFDSYAFFYNKKGDELWRSGEMGVIGNLLEGFYEKAVFKRIVWTNKFTKECLENSNIRPILSKE
jgi:hypothetical protein